MKILVVLAVILAAGVVEAAITDPWKQDGQWHADPSLTTCPEGQACIVDRTKTYACYQRMREAMERLDEIVRFNHESLSNRKPGENRISLNVGEGAFRQWAAVIKDCVHGARP